MDSLIKNDTDESCLVVPENVKLHCATPDTTERSESWDVITELSGEKLCTTLTYIDHRYSESPFCVLCDFVIVGENAESHILEDFHASEYRRHGCENINLREDNSHYCEYCDKELKSVADVYVHVKEGMHLTLVKDANTGGKGNENATLKVVNTAEDEVTSREENNTGDSQFSPSIFVERSDENHHFCQICGDTALMFVRYDCLESHLKGEQHKAALVKYNCENIVVIGKNKYLCEYCNVTISPESWGAIHSHVRSANHPLRVDGKNSAENGKEDIERVTEQSKNDAQSTPRSWFCRYIVKFSRSYYCNICRDVQFRVTRKNVRDHITSKEHRDSLEKKGCDRIVINERNYYQCLLCDFEIADRPTLFSHVKDEKHLSRLTSVEREDTSKNFTHGDTRTNSDCASDELSVITATDLPLVNGKKSVGNCESVIETSTERSRNEAKSTLHTLFCRYVVKCSRMKYYCHICRDGQFLVLRKDVNDHITGEEHAASLKSHGCDGIVINARSHYQCILCDFEITDRTKLIAHVWSEEHSGRLTMIDREDTSNNVSHGKATPNSEMGENIILRENNRYSDKEFGNAADVQWHVKEEMNAILVEDSNAASRHDEEATAKVGNTVEEEDVSPAGKNKIDTQISPCTFVKKSEGEGYFCLICDDTTRMHVRPDCLEPHVNGNQHKAALIKYGCEYIVAVRNNWYLCECCVTAINRKNWRQIYNHVRSARHLLLVNGKKSGRNGEKDIQQATEKSRNDTTKKNFQTSSCRYVMKYTEEKYYCYICSDEKLLVLRKDVDDHRTGKKHIACLKKYGCDSIVINERNYCHCVLCDVEIVNRAKLFSHVKDEKHLSRLTSVEREDPSKNSFLGETRTNSNIILREDSADKGPGSAAEIHCHVKEGMHLKSDGDTNSAREDDKGATPKVQSTVDGEKTSRKERNIADSLTSPCIFVNNVDNRKYFCQICGDTAPMFVGYKWLHHHVKGKEHKAGLVKYGCANIVVVENDIYHCECCNVLLKKKYWNKLYHHIRLEKHLLLANGKKSAGNGEKDIDIEPSIERSQNDANSTLRISFCRFVVKFSHKKYYCQICSEDQFLVLREDVNDHITGEEHTASLKRYGCKSIVINEKNHYQCVLCDFEITDRPGLFSHIKNEEHLSRLTTLDRGYTREDFAHEEFADFTATDVPTKIEEPSSFVEDHILDRHSSEFHELYDDILRRENNSYYRQCFDKDLENTAADQCHVEEGIHSILVKYSDSAKGDDEEATPKVGSTVEEEETSRDEKNTADSQTSPSIFVKRSDQEKYFCLICCDTAPALVRYNCLEPHLKEKEHKAAMVKYGCKYIVAMGNKSYFCESCNATFKGKKWTPIYNHLRTKKHLLLLNGKESSRNGVKDIEPTTEQSENDAKTNLRELFCRFVVKRSSQKYNCQICRDVEFCVLRKDVNDHITGEEHIASLKKYGCDSIVINEKNHYQCVLCDFEITDRPGLFSHIKNEEHLSRLTTLDRASEGFALEKRRLSRDCANDQLPESAARGSEKLSSCAENHISTDRDSTEFQRRASDNIIITEANSLYGEYCEKELDGIAEFLRQVKEGKLSTPIEDLNFASEDEDVPTPKLQDTEEAKTLQGEVSNADSDNPSCIFIKKADEKRYFCHICDDETPLFVYYKGLVPHMNGKQHEAALVKYGCKNILIDIWNKYWCDYCGISLGNRWNSLYKHVRSARHLALVDERKSAEKRENEVERATEEAAKDAKLKIPALSCPYVVKHSKGKYYCKICPGCADGISRTKVDKHIRGKQHADSLNKYGCERVVVNEKNNYECVLCDCEIVHLPTLHSHVQSKEHLSRLTSNERGDKSEDYSLEESTTNSNLIDESVCSTASDVPTDSDEPSSPVDPQNPIEDEDRTFEALLRREIFIDKLENGKHRCGICDSWRKFGCYSTAARHVKRLDHRSNLVKYGCENIVSDGDNEYRCVCCNAELSDRVELCRHVKSETHLSHVDEEKTNQRIEEMRNETLRRDGKEHGKKVSCMFVVKLDSTRYRCRICGDDYVITKKFRNDHITGRTHENSLKEYKCASIVRRGPRDWYCELCDTELGGRESAFAHVKSEEHSRPPRVPYRQNMISNFVVRETIDNSRCETNDKNSTRLPHSQNIMSKFVLEEVADVSQLETTKLTHLQNKMSNLVLEEGANESKYETEEDRSESAREVVEGKNVQREQSSSASSNRDLTLHYISCDPDILCGGFVPSTMKSYAVRIVKQHEDDPYCLICDFEIPGNRAIDDHIVGERHEKARRRYGCDNIYIVDGKKKFYCGWCDRALACVESLYRHIKTKKHSASVPPVVKNNQVFDGERNTVEAVEGMAEMDAVHRLNDGPSELAPPSWSDLMLQQNNDFYSRDTKEERSASEKPPKINTILSSLSADLSRMLAHMEVAETTQEKVTRVEQARTRRMEEKREKKAMKTRERKASASKTTSKGKKKISCTICAKQFTREVELHSHMTSHFGDEFSSVANKADESENEVARDYSSSDDSVAGSQSITRNENSSSVANSSTADGKFYFNFSFK